MKLAARVARLREAVDKMACAVHGLDHGKDEFRAEYRAAVAALDGIERELLKKSPLAARLLEMSSPDDETLKLAVGGAEEVAELIEAGIVERWPTGSVGMAGVIKQDAIPLIAAALLKQSCLTAATTREVEASKARLLVLAERARWLEYVQHLVGCERYGASKFTTAEGTVGAKAPGNCTCGLSEKIRAQEYPADAGEPPEEPHA